LVALCTKKQRKSYGKKIALYKSKGEITDFLSTQFLTRRNVVRDLYLALSPCYVSVAAAAALCTA